MADQKLSDLTDGGALVAGDETLVLRGGANYRATVQAATAVDQTARDAAATAQTAANTAGASAGAAQTRADNAFTAAGTAQATANGCYSAVAFDDATRVLTLTKAGGGTSTASIPGGGSAPTALKWAYAYFDASFSAVPSGNSVQPAFGGTGHDDLGVWSSAQPNRLTIPAGYAGWYVVQAQVYFSSYSSSGSRSIGVYASGSKMFEANSSANAATPVSLANVGSGTTTSGVMPTATSPLYLNAGDYLEVVVYSSATQNQASSGGGVQLVYLGG